MFHSYILSCVPCYFWAALCVLFCTAQRFTWETLDVVQSSASCQFSNLGTKASGEVTSHYRTSVKNAGSILSIELCFRKKRLSAVIWKLFCGQQDQSDAMWKLLILQTMALLNSKSCFFPCCTVLFLQLCHISRLLIHCCLLCGKLLW